MGMIDQMKYAKILYLADVLEDIQNEMDKDIRCSKHYGKSIIGIVKNLRETIADTTPPSEMACEQIEIKRLEHMQKYNMMDVPHGDIENFENFMCHNAEDELLHFIKKNKLIRVRKHEEDNGNAIFTASLIVGIEKQPYVPQEPKVTFLDDLAKYLDETRQ